MRRNSGFFRSALILILCQQGRTLVRLALIPEGRELCSIPLDCCERHRLQMDRISSAFSCVLTRTTIGRLSLPSLGIELVFNSHTPYDNKLSSRSHCLTWEHRMTANSNALAARGDIRVRLVVNLSHTSRRAAPQAS